MDGQDLYTINGLSIELGRDRRTIQRKLHGVTPAKVEGKSKYYRLSEVKHLLTDPKQQSRFEPSDDDGASVLAIALNSVATLAFCNMLNTCKDGLDKDLINQLVQAYAQTIADGKHFECIGGFQHFANLLGFPGRDYENVTAFLPPWVCKMLTPKTKRMLTVVSWEC